MKSEKILLALTVILMLIVSCATSYGPKQAMGGYSEEQLDDDFWIVAFEGNQYNDTEQLKTYLMYRCAELTLEQGFTHFMIYEDLSFRETLKKEIDNSDMTFETRTSMSGGVNMRVQSTFGAQEDGAETPIGIFKIKLLQGVDRTYAAASMDAQYYIEQNRHLIKMRK